MSIYQKAMAEKFSIGHIGGRQGPGIVKGMGAYIYIAGYDPGGV